MSLLVVNKRMYRFLDGVVAHALNFFRLNSRRLAV
jgi:hypothetical protein